MSEIKHCYICGATKDVMSHEFLVCRVLTGEGAYEETYKIFNLCEGHSSSLYKSILIKIIDNYDLNRIAVNKLIVEKLESIIK